MKLKVEKIVENLNIEISNDKTQLQENFDRYEFRNMKNFCIENLSEVAYLLENNMVFIEENIFNEQDSFLDEYISKYITKERFSDFATMIIEESKKVDKYIEEEYFRSVNNLKESYAIMNCILIKCKNNAILQLERYLENGYIADVKDSKVEEAVNLFCECFDIE